MDVRTFVKLGYSRDGNWDEDVMRTVMRNTFGTGGEWMQWECGGGGLVGTKNTLAVAIN